MCMEGFVFSLVEHTGAAVNLLDYKTGRSMNWLSICCGKQTQFPADTRLFPRFGFMLSRLSRALVAGSHLARLQLCSSPLQRFKEFIFSCIRALGGG